jgi:putative glycosyltransferase (TIGR04372 family)
MSHAIILDQIADATNALKQLEAKAGLYNLADYYEATRAITNSINDVILKSDQYFFLVCLKPLSQAFKEFHLEFIKSLLLCHQFQTATSELSKAVTAHGIQCFPENLLLRLFINSGIQQPIGLLKNTEQPSWVTHYAQTQEDRAYAAEILGFKIQFTPEGAVLLFTVQCSCCAETLQLDYNKDFIQDGVCLCKSCYAKLAFDRDQVAALGRDYFLTFLKQQPKAESGAISSGEALRDTMLLAKILSPMVLIRFGKLRTERIGHQIMNATYYYSRIKNNESCRVLDVLGESYHCEKKHAANRFLQDKINDGITDESTVMDPVGTQLGEMLPAENRHNITRYTFDLYEYPYSRTIQTTIPLHFTDEEKQNCQNELLKMGLPPNAPYVCLHVRSASYLKEQFKGFGDAFSYHDYRDSDVNDYIPAIKILNEAGIYVIRLGAAADLPDIDYSSPLFVDYARHYRSEMMDIFLSLHCKFMISTSSGIDMIPMCYQIPLLIVNLHPIHFMIPENPKLLIIAKKLYSKALNRILSLKELLELGGGYFQSQHIAARGFEIRDNTPDEILTVTQEMLELLEDRWSTTPEYNRKHQQLHTIGQYLSMLHIKRIASQRFGHDFLLKNTWDL